MVPPSGATPRSGATDSSGGSDPGEFESDHVATLCIETGELGWFRLGKSELEREQVGLGGRGRGTTSTSTEANAAPRSSQPSEKLPPDGWKTAGRTLPRARCPAGGSLPRLSRRALLPPPPLPLYLLGQSTGLAVPLSMTQARQVNGFTRHLIMMRRIRSLDDTEDSRVLEMPVPKF